MRQAGMDDFVRKPYRPREIYDCLTKHLGVQFLYENAAPADKPPQALTPDHVAGLPETLRGELKEALESLEYEHIARAIQQVGAYDAGLQKILLELADNYEYSAILKALYK